VIGFKYGFFSEQAAEEFGSAIWIGLDGKEVEVTAVFDTPDCSGYLWPDAVDVGQVIRSVRPHRVGFVEHVLALIPPPETIPQVVDE
jgi:hypothetical protein